MMAPSTNAKWNAQFSCFDLVAKTRHKSRSVVQVRGIEIGSDEVVIMAGPCAVESERQLLQTAEAVSTAGARILRGGAYKPRSSPYSFQGLGIEGLKLLNKARELTGLAIVTEVMSEEDVDIVAEYADIMQVGTRSMENFLIARSARGMQTPGLTEAWHGCPTRGRCLRSAQVLCFMRGQSLRCDPLRARHPYF